MVSGFDDFGRGVAFWGQFAIRAVPYGGPGVLEQPGERDPVLGRKFQIRSRRVGVGRAAAKIVEDRKDGKEPRYYRLCSYRRSFRLASPAWRNSDVLFQTGWPGAFPTATAVRKMTRSCCSAPS